MFRWDTGVNHSPSRENGAKVRLSWILNTCFTMVFHNFHALTEGLCCFDYFDLDVGYTGLIPIKKLWLTNIPSGFTISLRWRMLR